MNKIIIFAVLFVMVFQADAIAQNYLWLTNGKKLQISDYKIENPDLISYKNLKGKNKTIQTYEVFSINESSGKEFVVYIPDTSFQGTFNVPEMKSFVQGQFDAYENYKSTWAGIGGFGVAAISPLVINPMLVILVSTGYCSGAGLIKPKDKKLSIPSEFANDDHYKLGYKKAVKHKRIKNAIIGSGIGLIVGLGTYTIVNKK